jgi:hypothetical protein
VERTSNTTADSSETHRARVGNLPRLDNDPGPSMRATPSSPTTVARTHLRPLLLLALLTVVGSARAGEPVPGVTPDLRPVRTVVTLQRGAAPPPIEQVAAAMERGDDPAPGMARVEGFITRFPFDGLAGSERTVVYLGYDDRNLYAIWYCFDRDPTKVRAPVRRRDNIPDEDDSVALQIDTFHDHQHLQGFQASVNGAINDGTYTEGQGWDLSNDYDWHPEGRLTKVGYTIVMTIPFSALRFAPGAEQEFGFLMFRGMGRRNEADFFPWYSTTIGSRMLQTGTLTGIVIPPHKLRWQYTPFVTAHDTSTRDVSVAGPWEEDQGVEAGIDGKLVWDDRLVWDFTVNPDFSQVESDEPQVLTNQRFEVFFPEKRPFFIESAGYFSTPLDLLFTRRIVEPSVGLRLTGQTGRWAVAGLAIDDDAPPESFTTPGIGSATLLYYGMRRRGEQDSNVGGSVMHRSGPTETSELASLDGRQRLDEHWIATWQLAGSWNAPDAFAAPTSDGHALYAALNGSGRLWTLDLNGQEISDDFHAPVGFVPRLGVRKLDEYASYRFEPKLPWLLAVSPYAESHWVWDEDGLRLDQWLEPGLVFELPHATTLTLHSIALDERVTPTDFPALAQTTDFAQQRLGVHWRSAFSAQVLLDGTVHWGDFVNFVPAAGAPPALGTGLDLSFGATFFPTNMLELDATYLVNALDRPDGAPVFETRIVRLKANYHFDQDWQLRLIVDHGQTRSDPTQSSLVTGEALGGDLLLQWLPTPGNAFYLGLSQRQDAVPASAPLGGLAEPGALTVSGRSVFLKFSKRWDR